MEAEDIGYGRAMAISANRPHFVMVRPGGLRS
jgi:hypothetical protein